MSVLRAPLDPPLHVCPTLNPESPYPCPCPCPAAGITVMVGQEDAGSYLHQLLFSTTTARILEFQSQVDRAGSGVKGGVAAAAGGGSTPSPAPAPAPASDAPLFPSIIPSQGQGLLAPPPPAPTVPLPTSQQQQQLWSPLEYRRNVAHTHAHGQQVFDDEPPPVPPGVDAHVVLVHDSSASASRRLYMEHMSPEQGGALAAVAVAASPHQQQLQGAVSPCTPPPPTAAAVAATTSFSPSMSSGSDFASDSEVSMPVGASACHRQWAVP